MTADDTTRTPGDAGWKGEEAQSSVRQLDPDGASSEAPGLRLPPLVVSGLVVTKADLLAALRVYVPLATDISPLDCERFVLSLLTKSPEPPDTSQGGNTNG